jgi:exosome complex component RRP46
MEGGGASKAAPAAISFERLTRIDHRQADQFRPLKCEQGVLKQADGSARFMHGHTSVMTAVFGPMECARTSQELVDGSYVEVVFNAAVDDDSQKNKEYSEVLRRTFAPVVLRSLHPRTLLRIVVQVIKDDGAVLAAATNSVCMALMDAGFPMKTFAVGVSCLVSPKALTLDPTLTEERAGGVRTVRAVHMRESIVDLAVVHRVRGSLGVALIG